MDRSGNEVEHISSVQDNPFVKNFGIENVIQHRLEAKEAVAQEVKDTDKSNANNGEAEQEQEYHVNSGFVNKLRSKFAELESKNQRHISLSRRSASVENLLSLSSHSQAGHKEKTNYGNARQSSADDTKVEFRKKQPTSYLSKRSIERPRSNELKTKPDKPPSIKPPLAPKSKLLEFSKANNVIRSVKPSVPRRGSNEPLKKQRSSDSSPTKIEHHDWKVAPDLENIANDNIVIIETTPTSPRDVKLQEIQSEESNEKWQVRPLKNKFTEESKKENEFPKPNTVSAFLSIFEKGQKLVRPIQAWRKNLSPTRMSSSSGASSPRNSSPGVAPRSPLTKTLDDNVFTYAGEKSDSSNAIVFSNDTKHIPVAESKQQSPAALTLVTDSSYSSSKVQNDTKTDGDTNFFHSKNLVRRKSWENVVDSESSSSPVTSPRIDSEALLATPLHLVFDSSSVAPKKKTVKLKPEKKIHGHRVPKDTLALKHEKEYIKVKSPAKDNISKVLSPKEKKKTDFIEQKATSTENNENILLESNVKPSQRKAAKISPRKTKIFDSSNIVKVNREPPKIPSRTLNEMSKESKTKAKLNEISVEINDKDNKKEHVVSKPPHASQKDEKEIKTAFEKVTDNKVNKMQVSINTPKGYEFSKIQTNDTSASEQEIAAQKPSSTTENEPVTGVSTFVANRLKKSQDQSIGQQMKTSSVHLLNGSSPSPVPRKRPAPEIPTNSVSDDVDMTDDKNKSLPPPLPSSPEPTLPKTNIDDIISRRNKSAKPMPKMVFDSSKIANKRKDPPKRKPPRKTLEEINKIHTNGVVPKLDLSSITNDTNESEYQEGYIPTVIQPCPFKFIGGDIIPEKSPYKKTKKVKTELKISFDDHATTTFEYEGEEAALEAYLKEHPDEREEALKQEEESNAAISDVNDDPTKDSPRHSEQETLKSNTVIGQSTGALTNYKSKMQIDFQFGVPTESSDDDIFEPEPEHEVDPNCLQLLPADENELDTFSAEVNKSDMLF